MMAFAADVSQETPVYFGQSTANQKTETESLTKKPRRDPSEQDILRPEDGEIIHSNQQIFGNRGGYFHASIGVDFEYTDNLYNVDTDKQDNWLTYVSPSVWLTIPRRSKIPLHLAPHNSSPGGMQFSQPENYFFNEYQLYLGAGLVFKDYSENSSLNATDARLEGLLQYNLTSNITLAVTDRFTRSQDMFNLTSATLNNQRIYHSNILTAGIDWQISEKFSARLDYNFFTLTYNDVENRYFDRSDNGFDFYAFYDYSLKTNFFFQYRYLDASYDEQDDNYLDFDNSNTYIYGGINWKPTIKTTLMGKVGYQQAQFDNNRTGDDSPGLFSFELQANWQATIKTSLLLDATYSIEQTDTYNALNKKVFAGRLGYRQRFTDRLRGSIDFIYENSQYDEFDNSSREDDRFFFKPELQYAFRRWLTGSASYTFDAKESSKEYLDYETNIFKFGLKVSF
jgi:hypothetical protein